MVKMFKKGDLITNKKERLRTVHEVINYNDQTGVIDTVVYSGPMTGHQRRLTRPENYKLLRCDKCGMALKLAGGVWVHIDGENK